MKTRATTLVRFEYTNHRGETGSRLVEPVKVWHGISKYHADQQWFCQAIDVEKVPKEGRVGAKRDFAMNDVRNWRAASEADIAIAARISDPIDQE